MSDAKEHHCRGRVDYSARVSYDEILEYRVTTVNVRVHTLAGYGALYMVKEGSVRPKNTAGCA